VSQQKLHEKPSVDTQNFMTKMEIEIKVIKEKLELMPTKDEMLLCIEQAVDKTLEKAENKFASKSTERIVWGIMGAVGFSFLTFLGYLIYEATVHFSK
jgi:hypothetical protein